MKNIGKSLVLVAFGAGCFFLSENARSQDQCLKIGWNDQSGNWSYYRAWVTSVDANELHIKYDYNHGRMDLHVSENMGGNYVYKGVWREDYGREGGKVRLIMEAGNQHAKGFYTLGDWTTQHYDLKLIDCANTNPL